MATTIGSLDLNAFSDLHSDVTQYFWFESNSSSAWGSGAHVTLYPESQFTDSTSPNYMRGQNIIMNTDGFSIRNGALPMMVLDNDSLDFNAVDTTQGTYVTMATFGLTGATIGQSSGAHSVIDADGQRFYASDGTTQLANIGYGPGTNSSGGTSDAPYYTLGIRANENDDFIHDYVGTYSTSKTYNVGDLVLYNSSVYICKIKIDTPEPWTPSHWRIPIGNYSNSGGEFTISAGYASHAEGGDSTTALGLYSHAEGENTKALGDCSHTEGMNCIAKGQASHAEGEDTRTIGDCSHAEGMFCIAKGECSHAGNYETIASGFAQTVLGLCNIEDDTPITNPSNPYVDRRYAVIIGNGTPNAPSNAFTVDWNGNPMGQAMAGIVQMYAGAVAQTITNGVATVTGAPSGWLVCDGSEVSQTEYPTLYAVIGDTWGTATTSGYFKLPDLRGRAPIGAGTGSGLTARTLGTQNIGSEYIQAHTHAFTQPKTPKLTANSSHYITSEGAMSRDNGAALSGSSSYDYLRTAQNSTVGRSAPTINAGVACTGGAVGAVSGATTGSGGNMQPSAVVNFIICTGKTS